MKKMVLCAVAFFTLGSGISAQRQMNLSVEVVSPLSYEDMYINTPFNLLLKVTNNSNEPLQSTDSLYFYQVVNGDTMNFLPGDTDYISYTGISINPGESYLLTRYMAFGNATHNNYVELCTKILPVNAADPILETAEEDNESCVEFMLTDREETAGVEEITTGLLKISPNPAKKIISLGITADHGVARLVTTDGKLVQLLILNGEQADVSAIPNGVYFLEAEINGTPSVNRLVISH